MSLSLPRLISRKACYCQCLKDFHRRSYGAAALAHTTAHTEDADSSSSLVSPGLATVKNADAVQERGRNAPKIIQKADSPPTPLEHSKILEYLDGIKNTNITVQDLERFKPARYGRPGTPEYEKDYNSLIETICRSFNGKQLRYFAKLYNVHIRKSAKKQDLAIAIIEDGWKMPSLSEIQKQQRDSSEVVQRDFFLDSRQCFLLLGKDGANLLQLSSKYNVHISLSAAPLCLKVEGVRGSLERLAAYITGIKEDIDFEMFDMNKETISMELLHHISRKSGAFIEHNDDGKLRITYRKSDRATLSVAKRLLTMAIAEQMENPVLSYKQIETKEPDAASIKLYSLYPFILPYTPLRLSSATSLFRLRNVKVAGADKREATRLLAQTHSLTEAMTQRVFDIRNELLRRLGTDSTASSSTKIIRATLGHLLWPSSNTKAYLSPAFGRALPFEKVAEWMKGHRSSSIFSPSSPTQALSTPAEEQRILRRLIYKSSVSPESTRSSQTIMFEILASKRYLSASEDTSAEEISILGQDILDPSCRMEEGTVIDVMLPDRPMDIRFSMIDSIPISRSEWPAHLKEYYNELEAFLLANGATTLPEIPLKFSYKDGEFILKSTVSIQQNKKSIQVDDSSKFAISTESISTEDDEPTVLCQVECGNFDDASWEDFLRCCDLLTAH